MPLPLRALAVLGLACAVQPIACSQSPAFRLMKDVIAPQAGPVLGLADFDGDGDLDLLTNGTGILANDGNGFFSAPLVSYVVTTSTGLVGQPPNTPCVIGDLDGDGDPDVLTWGGPPPCTLRKWINQGGNPHTLVESTSDIPSGCLQVSALALGDVDQDGDLDVVIGLGPYTYCSVCTLPMKLWRNDGTGAFTESSGSLPAQPMRPPQILLRDFDGDGDLDLLTGGNNPVVSLATLSPAMIFWNGGGGVFSQTGVVLPVSVSQSLAAAGDVDGNGLIDLAFEQSPAQLWYGCAPDTIPSVLLNKGGGVFSPTASPIGISTRGVPVLVDLDGNGKSDLLRLTPSGATTHLLGGAGAIGPATLTAPAYIAPLNSASGQVSEALASAVGDVDGDGDEDVVLFTGQGNQVVFNDSTGHPHASRGSIAAAWTSPDRALGAGDLEGDGDLDLFLGFSSCMYAGGSSTLHFGINDGTGSLIEGPPMTFAGGTASSGTPFDADGDGDLDVYATAGLSYTVVPPLHRILINTGTGFTVSQSFLVGSGVASTFAMKTGDLDNDGDLDVVTGMSGFPGLTPFASPILLNDGTGHFQIASYLPPAATFDVALADVDGDGDLDIIQANSYSSLSALLLNDGSATFTQAAGFPLITAASVQTGDLDLDGDVDLLMNSTILANSAGTFYIVGNTAVPGWAPGQSGMPSLSLVDVDLDGYPDLLMSNGWLARNLGGVAAFTSPEMLPGPLVGPIVHADFDRDGDEDVVARGPAILTNMKRQLARGMPARPGRPASLQIGGPTGTPWFLFASTAPASLPLAPLGTVLIDLPTIQLAATGTVPSSGAASFAGIAPSGPGVIGFTVWWQAALLEPQGLRLTGREATTIEAY